MLFMLIGLHAGCCLLWNCLIGWTGCRLLLLLFTWFVLKVLCCCCFASVWFGLLVIVFVIRGWLTCCLRGLIYMYFLRLRFLLALDLMFLLLCFNALFILSSSF